MCCTNLFDVNSIFFPFMTVFSNEDYSQTSACCTFKGPGLKDIEYILIDRFNKKVMKEFNSTRGNWTGFTNYSIEVAKDWNSDPYDALRRAFEKKLLCTDRKDYIQDLGKTCLFFLRLLSINGFLDTVDIQRTDIWTCRSRKSTGCIVKHNSQLTAL